MGRALWYYLILFPSNWVKPLETANSQNFDFSQKKVVQNYFLSRQTKLPIFYYYFVTSIIWALQTNRNFGSDQIEKIPTHTQQQSQIRVLKRQIIWYDKQMVNNEKINNSMKYTAKTINK